MKENLLFICYSLPLKNYLVKNGQQVSVSGKHMRTDNPFWVFIRNKQLNNLLTTWSKGKDEWIYEIHNSCSERLQEY